MEQPKTSCVDVDTLQAFVSGALTGERLTTVETHLASCDLCQRGVAELVALATRSTSVGDEPTERTPRALVPRRGEIIVDRYRVGDPIGRGGMGSVVAATHLELGHTVAIKFLHLHDRASLARFVREGRTVARLRSPHIVRVLDAGHTQQGVPFLVMERLEGGDLATLVARGPLPLTAAIRYLRQACAALQVAHGAGIIHRDLKPSNLFITPDEQLKVLDFGISKHVRATEHTDATITVTGHVIGSPRYMSPEQLQGTREVDERSDIWSLGVIMYELLAGRPPFDHRSFSALAIAIATERPPAPSHYQPALPPELDAITMRCLEKEPARRYQAVAELDTALETVEKPRPARSSQRRHWSVSLMFVLPLLAAIAAAVSLRHRQRGAEAPEVATAAATRPVSTAVAKCERCLDTSCSAQQQACTANETCASLREIANSAQRPLVAEPRFMLSLFDHWWSLEAQTGSMADVRSELTSCARTQCREPCNVGRSLDCVGNFDWPVSYPSHASLRYRLIVINNPSHSLAGWHVRACAPGTLCETEMGSGTTDDRGMVTLDLDLSRLRENANALPEFNGFITFDGGPDFYPQILRLSLPTPTRWYTRLALNPREQMRKIREPRGLGLPNAQQGLVDVQMQDCGYKSVWGVTLEIWRYGAGHYEPCTDCVIAYPDDSGTPDTTVREIKSWSRAASEVVLSPGEYALAARDTESKRLVAFMNHIEVRAGYEHALLLFPASRDELQHVPAEIRDVGGAK